MCGQLDKNGYAPSIMQKDKYCYVSGMTNCDLVRHEIFGGALRTKSKQLGLWVYLTPYWHNMSDKAVHFNKALDLRLKMEAQQKFEETHTHDEWMREIGKNYL